jgi:hypothetical protein
MITNSHKTLVGKQERKMSLVRPAVDVDGRRVLK